MAHKYRKPVKSRKTPRKLKKIKAIAQALTEKEQIEYGELDRPKAWLSAVVKNENVSPTYLWSINKERIFYEYGKKYWRTHNKDGDGYTLSESRPTAPSFDRCVQYAPPVLTVVMPDGKIITPIRQFCEHKVLPPGSREAFFYDFGSIVYAKQEGEIEYTTRPKITSSRAELRPRGSSVDISYQNLEDNLPIDIVAASNRSFALESVKDENREILERTFGITEPLKGHWLNGYGGSAILSDEYGVLTIKGLIAAREAIENQGLDTSNLILYTTEKATRDLVNDPDIDEYIDSVHKPDIIELSVIERITGIIIVKSAHIPAITKMIDEESDVYETYWQRFKRVLLFKKKIKNIITKEITVGWNSVLFVPNIAFGLVTGEKITMEAIRRNEIGAISLTGTQRIVGVTKNKECFVRISHE